MSEVVSVHGEVPSSPKGVWSVVTPSLAKMASSSLVHCLRGPSLRFLEKNKYFYLIWWTVREKGWGRKCVSPTFSWDALGSHHLGSLACSLGLRKAWSSIIFNSISESVWLSATRFCLECVFSGPQLVRVVCAEYVLIAYLNVDVCDKIIPPVVLF